MIGSVHFSNEELTAYLDDEIGPAERRRINAALEVNTNLKVQLDSLKIDRAMLKADFDDLMQSAPRYNVNHVTTIEVVQIPTDNRLKFAVVGALCAMMAWVAATGLFRAPPITWQEKAAIYHSLYVNRTISDVVTNPASAQVELERATKALGKDIFLANLNRIPEFEYKRSQILGFEGRPLLQVAFLSRIGSPIVLCIMRGDIVAAKGIKTDVIQGMAAATWSKGAYEYLLIGGSDKELIARAANTFAAVL